MWTCPECNHTQPHEPGGRDENAKVKRCTGCPRCRFFESLKSPIPRGFGMGR